jgi:ribosomal protein L1
MNSEISEDLLRSAVHAALLFANDDEPVTTQRSVLALFDAPQSPHHPIQIEVSFLRAPKPSRVPMLFKLPHEVLSSNNICLITPEPQRKYKDQLTAEGADGVVTKVMDVVKLQGKFANPIARRSLAKSFDAFFVHSDLEAFPSLLTGEFLTWQTPVWMDHDAKSLAGKVAATRRMAVMPRRGFDYASVTIGHTGLNENEILDNFKSFADQLKSADDSMRVLGLRLAVVNSKKRRIALPVYAHQFTEAACSGPEEIHIGKRHRGEAL